jgi:hypothetical protein
MTRDGDRERAPASWTILLLVGICVTALLRACGVI